MARPGIWTCILAVCLASSSMLASAQGPKKITIRVLDGRTGDKITPDNIEVRVNRQRTLHVEWVKMHDDGSAEVSLPENTTAFAVRATYDQSMDYYVNCDVARQKDTSVETWFPLDDVLKEGLVMPNECWKHKDVKDVKFTAGPGEFVLLVRKRSIRDQIPYSLPY